MEINRNNYEEYFISYIDRELDPAGRIAVEEFLEANPDLKEELAILRDVTIQPEDVRFANKETLLRPLGEAHAVHEGNFEEMFLLYVDNELDLTQRKVVEAFASADQRYQAALEQLKLVRLLPDRSIRYADKHLLYRGTGLVRPLVRRRLLALASAAAVILIAGAVWFSGDTPPRSPVTARLVPAVVAPAELPTGPAPTVVPSAGLPAHTIDNEVQKKSVARRNATESETKPAASPETPAAHKILKQPVVTPELAIKTPKPVTPADAQTIQGIIPAPEPANGNTDRTELSFQKPAIIDEVVEVSPSDFQESQNPVILTNISDENKSSFRGILRKAARVIERNTVAKPSKKPGIHIGNLEIVFQ